MLVPKPKLVQRRKSSKVEQIIRAIQPLRLDFKILNRDQNQFRNRCRLQGQLNKLQLQIKIKFKSSMKWKEWKIHPNSEYKFKNFIIIHFYFFISISYAHARTCGWLFLKCDVTTTFVIVHFTGGKLWQKQRWIGLDLMSIE